MPFHPQPLFFLVLGLVAGTLVPSPRVETPLVVALGLAALLAALAALRPARVPLIGLIVAASAAGCALATAASIAYSAHVLPESIAQVSGAVVLEGRLATDPRIVDAEMRFDVSSDRITAEQVEHAYRGRIRVFVRSQAAEPFESTRGLKRGDAIRVWIDLRRPEPVRTPGHVPIASPIR